MSSGSAQISRLLDFIQQIGETPAVNPARLTDGQLPKLTVSSPDLGFVGWMLVALVGALAIALVALFGPPVSGGFIYEHF